MTEVLCEKENKYVSSQIFDEQNSQQVVHPNPQQVIHQISPQISPQAEFRLKAYKMYQRGTVNWSHPSIDGILEASCKDPDNPNTYSFPWFNLSGKAEITNPVIFFKKDEKINWGVLHCVFEKLYFLGWVCFPSKTDGTMIFE